MKLDTLRERSEVDTLQYKAIALRHMKKAVEDADSSNDDFVMASIIAMLSFEVWLNWIHCCHLLTTYDVRS